MRTKLLSILRTSSSIRTLSTKAAPPPQPPPDTPSAKAPSPKPAKKTIAQLDEEMRLKMEGISGDGGASGVEYEDGKAEGLRRGVKENMFRVI